jgi:thymidylate synthase
MDLFHSSPGFLSPSSSSRTLTLRTVLPPESQPKQEKSPQPQQQQQQQVFHSPYLASLSANNRHEEYQYLDLIRHIIENGQHRPDRTGTGTVAMFAPPSFRFSLANNTLPLLTTKRVFTRGVIEELLWFVAGHTDGKILSDKGVGIWEGNGSREYLDKIGLGHRRVGDLGPVYGFQWRHFGAKYGTCEDDYTGQGVDQLQQVIDKIKNNPTDRRIIMSAWNPAGQ